MTSRGPHKDHTNINPLINLHTTISPPYKMMDRVTGLLSPGASVLDIGCGDGRNAIYLASKGFKVTAYDISVARIGRLLLLAQKQHVTIDAFVGDMREYRYSHTYDLIVCMGVLHLVTREEALRVIKEMKEHTAPGGYNIVGVLTDTLPEPADVEGMMVGLFKENELMGYYKDWEISDIKVYTFKDSHPDGAVHEHAANEIVARKS
jgi:tellurite methyltransferase